MIILILWVFSKVNIVGLQQGVELFQVLMPDTASSIRM